MDGTPIARPALDPAAAWSRSGALARALIVLGLLGLVYHRTVVTLWQTWQTNDNYSHGPLVPLVSAFLIWRNRASLAALPVREDSRGLVVVAMACLLQVLGMRADVFALQGYSLVIMAFGLAWTFLGTAWMRPLAFPLGYLVFMLVFPPFVVNQLSYWLKEVTVRLSTQAAEWCGVALQRSGMTLYFATGELRIENPCSGLRSLIALLATGAVFAYFQPGGTLRRSILMLAAVPIAMIANAVRITAVILVAHYGTVTQAAGAFHDWSGYLVYAVALAGLLAVRALLTPRGARA